MLTGAGRCELVPDILSKLAQEGSRTVRVIDGIGSRRCTRRVDGVRTESCDHSRITFVTGNRRDTGGVGQAIGILTIGEAISIVIGSITAVLDRPGRGQIKNECSGTGKTIARVGSSPCPDTEPVGLTGNHIDGHFRPVLLTGRRGVLCHVTIACKDCQ